MFLKYARLVYFGLFFWLPSRYISRFLFFYLQMKFGRPVDDLAKQNILRAAARRRGLYIQGDDAQAVSDYPGHLDSLEGSWHAFLDLLLGESKWAIYSVVSFLFISGSTILVFVQVPGPANNSPILFAAWISMSCGLLSLIHGVLCYNHIGLLRNTFQSTILFFEWEKDVDCGGPDILWNIWISLSMPAVWLVWSMVSFLIYIVSYIWGVGAVNGDPHQMEKTKLGLRVLMTSCLCLGLVSVVSSNAMFQRNERLMGEWLQTLIRVLPAREPHGVSGVPHTDESQGASGVPQTGEPHGASASGVPHTDESQGASVAPKTREPHSASGVPDADKSQGASGVPKTGEPQSGVPQTGYPPIQQFLRHGQTVSTIASQPSRPLPPAKLEDPATL